MKHLLLSILLLGSQLHAAEPQRFDLTKRASEIDPRAKEHPEIKFTFTDDKGKSAESIRRTSRSSIVMGSGFGGHFRAVQGFPNILVEISGFDPTAGFLEMAVREMGAHRILFARERSFATEFAKVLGAAISDDDRKLIFGGNLRRLLAPMFNRKGWTMA